MSTTTSSTSPGVGFAQRLRESTMGAHAHAETSPFFTQLFDGTLPVGAYLTLVVQQQAVYHALEAPADRMREHPVIGPFVVDLLHRSPALDRDVAHLRPLAPDADPALSPATLEFVARLEEVADTPHRWLAHHYTRYMGDLSGGQQMRKAAEKAYGLGGGSGAEFYRFPGLGAPARFKDAYRARLDAADWDEQHRAEVIEEVLLAYRLNTSLVRDLSTTGSGSR